MVERRQVTSVVRLPIKSKSARKNSNKKKEYYSKRQDTIRGELRANNYLTGRRGLARISIIFGTGCLRGREDLKRVGNLVTCNVGGEVECK